MLKLVLKLLFTLLILCAPGICRSQDSQDNDDEISLDSNDDSLRRQAKKGHVEAQLKLADEYFYGKGLCVVEWADKIAALLPPPLQNAISRGAAAPYSIAMTRG